MTWRWLFIFPLAWGVWDYWATRPIVHPPGVLVSAEPVQAGLDATPRPLTRRGYQIVPLQSFSLAARVLSKERYRFDDGADISPVDLALGWGQMSDQAVLQAFDISQSGRFYFWHVKQFPIPRREIETHSANMHMIPATEDIERRLLGIRRRADRHPGRLPCGGPRRERVALAQLVDARRHRSGRLRAGLG